MCKLVDEPSYVSLGLRSIYEEIPFDEIFVFIQGIVKVILITLAIEHSEVDRLRYKSNIFCSGGEWVSCDI